MIAFEPGDTALILFPFTDLSANKKRPVVIVSPSSFTNQYGDIVVMAITGANQSDDASRLDDWQQAGLLKQSWLKPLLGTLSVSLIDRRLGRLSTRDRKRTVAIIELMLAKNL